MPTGAVGLAVQAVRDTTVLIPSGVFKGMARGEALAELNAALLRDAAAFVHGGVGVSSEPDVDLSSCLEDYLHYAQKIHSSSAGPVTHTSYH